MVDAPAQTARSSEGPVRFFISCSWDMVHEAQTAMRVINRLSAEASFRCDHYHWTADRPPPWPANRPFQEQIPRAKEFDFVIYLAGDRVGSALPDRFRKEGLIGFQELDRYFENAFAKLLRADNAPLPLTGTIYVTLRSCLTRLQKELRNRSVRNGSKSSAARSSK
jgi:hypothetical protein